jgi:tetratricopeptide (TPR) repeat protein
VKIIKTKLAISVLLMCVGAAFAQPDPEFNKANDEYAKGQFQDAIRDYETLVHSQQWSAPLFYNLGNAYFRRNDFGRAILNYERALALDPHHPEAATNLSLARDEARALELQKSRSDTLLRFVTPDQMTIAAVIALWIAIFSMAILLFRRRRSAVPVPVAVVALAVAAFSALAVYYMEGSRNALAIITAPEVEARLATADNAGSVLHLPSGSEILILSERGDWLYALLPNNLHGWVPTDSAASVRL